MLNMCYLYFHAQNYLCEFGQSLTTYNDTRRYMYFDNMHMSQILKGNAVSSNSEH